MPFWPKIAVIGNIQLAEIIATIAITDTAKSFTQLVADGEIDRNGNCGVGMRNENYSKSMSGEGG